MQNVPMKNFENQLIFGEDNGRWSENVGRFLRHSGRLHFLTWLSLSQFA